MFVKVFIDKWKPFPGSNGSLPERLPSELNSVYVCSTGDDKIEQELSDKLYLQFGAVPAKMRFVKKEIRK